MVYIKVQISRINWDIYTTGRISDHCKPWYIWFQCFSTRKDMTINCNSSDSMSVENIGPECLFSQRRYIKIWVPRLCTYHEIADHDSRHNWCWSGPGCSKLTTSLVNEMLNVPNVNISNMPICQYFLLKNVRRFWTAKASLIFSTKISVFDYRVVKHLTSWPLNEFVKLTMLWTTGPRSLALVCSIVLINAVINYKY